MSHQMKEKLTLNLEVLVWGQCEELSLSLFALVNYLFGRKQSSPSHVEVVTDCVVITISRV